MIYPYFKICVQCMTYNHAPFIRKAMDGFCMQKTNFAFVSYIIDDASTDGEQDVIISYLNSNFDLINRELKYVDKDEVRVIYAHNKNNKNCYFVVVLLKNNLYKKKDNYRIKLKLVSEWRSHCDYEAQCEGDDYWIDENKLQRQSDFLDSHTRYSICSHRILKYDQDTGIFYCDRLDKMFSGRNGCDFDNHSGVWISETSSILYRMSAIKEYLKYSYEHRDCLQMYFLLKDGKGFCLSNKMSVYRQHEGGVFSKQDAITRLVNGTYKAVKDLYENEKTDDARLIYYRNYAYAFLKTKGKVLFMEKFDYRKFFSLFYNLPRIVLGKHPLYVACKD